MNGNFFKRYRVGSGKYGKTPVGTFKVSEKIKNPDWWRPDGSRIPFGEKGNVLGTRWIAISATGDTEPVRGYGIHGTWENDSVGRSSSQGCLRMHNSEVEELFVYIPLGAKLTITE
jgi:lipoprotein-anchoring transpeptidase ErfK/SrfK